MIALPRALGGQRMPLRKEDLDLLHKFVESHDFSRGMLVLDLDGTALLEDRGKVFISSSVEKGVKAIHDLGQTVVVNTLRFPLSVIRTVGDAWYQIADVPILTVLLNGSVLGYIKSQANDLIYEELAAFPLPADEIQALLTGIRQLLSAGIEDMLLFYYTRDWQAGETLWTPSKSRVPALQSKYVSAARVLSGGADLLEDWLSEGEVCMASLLIDRPEDSLMAYQHSKRNSFFTRKGVDKASGIREIAKRFDRSLVDSFGAGDTEMDTFLSEVGFAVIVGGAALPYRGLVETLRVDSPSELGEAITHLADMAAAKGRL
jgi:hydroxymethylpyrimidine pyrophosphatase-like HAD family hydrolase